MALAISIAVDQTEGMEPPHIRPAHLDDLDLLEGVERSADKVFGERIESLGNRDVTVDAYHLRDALVDGRLWVAELDGRIVGFAMVEDNGGAPHLQQVSVVPECQRQGIGRALVEEACAAARAAGAEAITLSTFRDVPWNAPFYERLGFEVLQPSQWTEAMVAVREGEARAGLDVAQRVVMRRRLSRRYPSEIDAGAARLVRFRPAMAEELTELINRNFDHLHPWMDWLPARTTVEATRETMERFVATFDAGEDFAYAIVDPATDRIIGGSGIHCRSTDAVRELGYWVDAACQGRGIVTAVVRTLSHVAFDDWSVERVEIRCDQRNERSAAVAQRCGFVLLGEEERPERTPGGSARTLVWSLDREHLPVVVDDERVTVSR